MAKSPEIILGNALIYSLMALMLSITACGARDNRTEEQKIADKKAYNDEHTRHFTIKGMYKIEHWGPGEDELIWIDDNGTEYVMETDNDEDARKYWAMSKVGDRVRIWWDGFVRGKKHIYSMVIEK